MNLKNLPKVELHLHLDGSIRPQTASELLNINIEEVEKNMIAQAECNNLNDYLTINDNEYIICGYGGLQTRFNDDMVKEYNQNER